jgi:hypothetical protein
MNLIRLQKRLESPCHHRKNNRYRRAAPVRQKSHIAGWAPLHFSLSLRQKALLDQRSPIRVGRTSFQVASFHAHEITPDCHDTEEISHGQSSCGEGVPTQRNPRGIRAQVFQYDLTLCTPESDASAHRSGIAGRADAGYREA